MYISYKSRKYLIRAGSGGLGWGVGVGWGPPPPKNPNSSNSHCKITENRPCNPFRQTELSFGTPPPHLQRKNNLICVCSYVKSETAWYKSY